MRAVNAPVIAFLAVLVLLAGARHACAQQPARNTLKGFAALPARTFAAGPVSGQFISGTNGVSVPFASQPVQGFSSVLRNADGTYTVLEDNGYGAKNNSADFVLRFYNIAPDFKTAAGGTGNIAVGGSITLSDPDRKLGFNIVADGANYPNGANNVPVDPAIRAGRLLTGADFDIESFRRVADGSFWIGDEFGPFLLHVGPDGKVLDAPVSLPNVNNFGANPLIQSADNPFRMIGDPAANLPGSGGFEGMALSADGTKLYPLLERTVTGDPDPRRLLINEFDIAAKRYTGSQFFYRKESAGNFIGEMTAVNESEYLVIERDNSQGSAAAFKKIFLVNLNQRDADGFVQKTELVNLLDIDDPNNLGGAGTVGGKFTFPFQTIESVVVVDENTLGVLNDNNFPFSSGRTPGAPDNNEFILVGLGNRLRTTATAIPEPATLVLFAAGSLLGLPLVKRKKKP